MKKTVEIEYVGIEDIQEIMDDAYALMRQGHYVDVELSNIGSPRLNVDIWLGGWNSAKSRDYSFEFHMTESEKDVAEMDKCKSILKNLLAEE